MNFNPVSHGTKKCPQFIHNRETEKPLTLFDKSTGEDTGCDPGTGPGRPGGTIGHRGFLEEGPPATAPDRVIFGGEKNPVRPDGSLIIVVENMGYLNQYKIE